MPIYETVLQEKPPVVLEIGSAYTKVGFSAEPFPRFIIPSRVLGPAKNVLDHSIGEQLYDQLVEMLQTIFFKHLLVSPKERKVVVVESVFCPTVIRDSLARALFRHFEVSSLFFVPGHLVVLSTLAIDTALVVDLGYKETTVIPVYSGVQVVKAFQAQSYGGEAVHQEIKRQLVDGGIEENLLTEDIIEDIKVRTCFVTKRERALQFRESKLTEPCPDVDYPLNGKEIIKIPGVLRETAMEILFPDDNENASLAHIILDTIIACPLDMRRDLADNLVLMGGTAMMPGLMARLKAEIQYLLESDYYKDRLFVKTVKFHKLIGKPNYAAWLGGAIYGGTDLVLSKSVSKDNYSKSGRIPDWSCLDDNVGL